MDIRLILGRLRPSSEYHWKGGAFDDYSQIGEWRDLSNAKPTLADIEAEWAIYLSEKAIQDTFEAEKTQAENAAVAAYPNLPDWLKTVTAQQTADYIHQNILNGFTSVQVDTYIDGLPNTVAGMKTGLKQIGGALVAIRDILEIIVKLLMYIRDLVIRYKS